MTETTPPTDAQPPNSEPLKTELPSDLVATALRQPEALAEPIGHDTRTFLRLAALLLPAMSIVGLLMGTFSGGWQLVVVPIKVMLGTVAAMAVCLPSLFVFSNLAGSRIDLRRALGSMTLAVAVLSFVLLALAPIALVFSLSTDSISLVGWIHVLFLLAAAWFGGSALGRAWGATAGGSSPAAIWMLLFVIVLLQFSTTLRPLLGEYAPLALDEKKIFIEHWFDPDRPAPQAQKRESQPRSSSR